MPTAARLAEAGDRRGVRSDAGLGVRDARRAAVPEALGVAAVPAEAVAMNSGRRRRTDPCGRRLVQGQLVRTATTSSASRPEARRADPSSGSGMGLVACFACRDSAAPVPGRTGWGSGRSHGHCPISVRTRPCGPVSAAGAPVNAPGTSARPSATGPRLHCGGSAGIPMTGLHLTPRRQGKGTSTFRDKEESERQCRSPSSSSRTASSSAG